jgi:hypothetical protein
MDVHLTLRKPRFRTHQFLWIGVFSTFACGEGPTDKRVLTNESSVESSDATPNDFSNHVYQPLQGENFANMRADAENFVYHGPISFDRLREFRAQDRMNVKVLELRYFPVKGDRLDSKVTGFDLSLKDIRKRVGEFSAELPIRLGEATHSLRSTVNAPYLAYQVVSSHEFLKPVELRSQVCPGKAYCADHTAMFEYDVDVCDYVDNQGVRDVWVWMYHNDFATSPIETNMSMGRKSARWFNYSGYGDVSNSYRENDLPICENTYIVYEFNYNRGVTEALHNYGHHREAVYRWLDGNLMRERFELPYGTTGVNACGNTHFPPNGVSDYDYRSKTTLKAQCTKWSPAGDGAVENINCNAWNCTEKDYHIWWTKRLPGRGNGIKDGNKSLRNYHEFFADFDLAVALGPVLYELPVESIMPRGITVPVVCPRGWESRCSILSQEVSQGLGSCSSLLRPRGVTTGGQLGRAVQRDLDTCVQQHLEQIMEMAVAPEVNFDYFIVYNNVEIIKFSP